MYTEDACLDLLETSYQLAFFQQLPRRETIIKNCFLAPNETAFPIKLETSASMKSTGIVSNLFAKES